MVFLPGRPKNLFLFYYCPAVVLVFVFMLANSGLVFPGILSDLSIYSQVLFISGESFLELQFLKFCSLVLLCFLLGGSYCTYVRFSLPVCSLEVFVSSFSIILEFSHLLFI